MSFFTKEISRIRDARRFVTADEVRFLLEVFLERDPESTLKPPGSGRRNVYVLKASNEFQACIRAFAHDDDGTKEVLRKFSGGQGVLVTFDSAEACRDDNIVFVTLHSPLIKAILRFADQDSTRVSLPLGKLRIRSYNGLLGSYFLFLYLLELTGAKKSLQMVPIMVSTLDSNKCFFYDEVTDLILGKLFDGEDLDDDVGLTDESICAAEYVADDYITQIREEEETKLKRYNEILLNNRIASVRQALDLKENRIRQTIQTLNQGGKPDQRILRLHKGRMRNLRQNAEDEILKWEKKRVVSVGYRRIAGVLINFRLIFDCQPAQELKKKV